MKPATFHPIARHVSRNFLTFLLSAMLTARGGEPTPESVLAELEEIAGAAQLAVRTGTPPPKLPCGSQVLHLTTQVLPAMTRAQQDRAVRLLPAIEPALRRRREIAAGGPITNALPTYSTLVKTINTRRCTVHYALLTATTGFPADPVNGVPDDAYAQTVADAVDRAVVAEGNIFGRALAEGGGKLHVYIVDTRPIFGGTRVEGATQPVPTAASPSPAPVFMYIDNTLRDRYGTEADQRLKVTVYHEYFHGVQDRYNFGCHQWMQESQAVWAEVHFANFSKDLAAYVNNSATSVVNDPKRSIWDAASLADTREYSAGTFVLTLVDERGIGAIGDWLKEMKGTDDAQKGLVDSLGDVKIFQKVYRKYLLDLFQKRIPHLGNGQTASVPEETMETMLGVDLGPVSAPPTGAFFKRIKSDSRIDNDYWLAKIEAGSGGHPELLFIKNPDSGRKIEDVQPKEDYEELANYNKADEVLVILTDTEERFETATTTNHDGKVISPFFKVKDTMAQSPINAGEVSDIHVTYDLIGTPPSMPFFPVEVKVVEIGPDVQDNATGDKSYRTGENLDSLFTFTTSPSTKGHYRFRVRFTTPTKSFAKKVPRSTDDTKFSVDVIGSGALPDGVVIDEAPAWAAPSKLEQLISSGLP